TGLSPAIVEVRRGLMTAVRLDSVTKSYPRHRHPPGGLKQAVLHLPSTIRSWRRERLLALRDVSITVTSAETLGLIGANGSGKSTLLGLIAGVLRPDVGHVETNGRLCPLLELGAGFHVDLTGRENVVMNGVLLGLTRRQVQERMDAIVGFSELEPFV